MYRISLLFVAALLGAGVASAASPAVSEAQDLMARGQFQEALSRLDSHIRAAPQDAEARFARGLALVRLNRNDDAIKAFTDLTRDYPQLPEPYNNLAVIYAQQGEYDKAREALETALATHPSYPVAHENLGDIYAALAAAAYNRALSLDPKNGAVKAKAQLVAQLESLADSGATVAARGSTAITSPTPPAPADTDGIARLVDDWAAAWSAKDVERYLGFYAPGFVPEGGNSRQAWEAQRRSRVSGPKTIKVTVSDLKVDSLAGGGAQATFSQDYASDVLTNHATKVLEFTQVDGQWRIRREYTR